MNALELFSGIGGLALGLSKAGFKHTANIEIDRSINKIIKENKKRHLTHVKDWLLIEENICNLDFNLFPKNLDLLAAGPPCQPFSFAGKHRGELDERNMFPYLLLAIRTLKPKAIIMENVRGMLRESFADYFAYINLQLKYPDFLPQNGENWRKHLIMLIEHNKSGKFNDVIYNIKYRVLNAADYGVPQQRHRVFIVGFRQDITTEWEFPNPDHSKDVLLLSQYITNKYLEKHKIKKSILPQISKNTYDKISSSEISVKKPWVTVRDAISNLPNPKFNNVYNDHYYIPGAKSYKGHTGSRLDFPSKTIKAGVHGVPGGENSLQLDNGDFRYLTIRECARLQTFPDNFVFNVPKSTAIKGLGNSVPVTLAEKIAKSIFHVIKNIK